MRLTISTNAPTVSVARRAIPWFVLVAVLAVGVALCFLLGPRVVPFFSGGAS